MTRNVKALETIINAAGHHDALCEGGWAGLGGRVSAARPHQDHVRMDVPTGVLRALAIPNLRA